MLQIGLFLLHRFQVHLSFTTWYPIFSSHPMLFYCFYFQILCFSVLWLSFFLSKSFLRFFFSSLIIPIFYFRLLNIFIRIALKSFVPIPVPRLFVGMFLMINFFLTMGHTPLFLYTCLVIFNYIQDIVMLPCRYSGMCSLSECRGFGSCSEFGLNLWKFDD